MRRTEKVHVNTHEVHGSDGERARREVLGTSVCGGRSMFITKVLPLKHLYLGFNAERMSRYNPYLSQDKDVHTIIWCWEGNLTPQITNTNTVNTNSSSKQGLLS